MTEAALLQLRSVRFQHADGFTLAVDGLQLHARERVALIGPSGCGKTTLMHLVAGILQPAAGEIWVAGSAIHGLGDRARRRFRLNHLGMVFQEFELVDYLTARENLTLPFRLGAQPAADEDPSARAQRVAQRLGIDALLNRRPSQLSQGERQRVALGRAIMTQPQLVLADEPTGNLDPSSARRSLDLLFEQAAAEGAATLVVTHDHSLLDRFDRIVELPDLREGAV